jgi:6-phosphofructokinase
MRIGVLTGGGDCPGLNAVIRAVARRAWANGHEVIGVREGWRGMVEHLFEPLGPQQISGILPRGGTIIGTSRTNPYKVDGGVEKVRAAFKELDALVVMGRHAGWIAVHSGIAGGADVILIPERPVVFEDVCEEIRRRHGRGKNFSIVVISEGCELPGADDKGDVDQFGHKLLAKRGVGERLGDEIEERTGFETRVTVLGHVQRGGSPTPRDRILATRFGLKAADLIEAGEFGQMAALRGDDVIACSLKEATAELKTVTPEWYDVAKAFFG